MHYVVLRKPYAVRALHNAPPHTHAQAAFLEKLAWLDARFAAHGGPYLAGAQYTIGDITCISFMERLAAGVCVCVCVSVCVCLCVHSLGGRG